MVTADDLRRAVLRADPHLSRFDPLERMLCVDRFDNGYAGWTELTGNYRGQLGVSGSMYGHLQFDMRPPMLSTLSMWDTGTVGSVDGNYALKLATRPQRGHDAQSIKRLTLAGRGLLQWEAFYTYKVEASRLEMSAGTETHYRRLGITSDDGTPDGTEHVRAFGFCYDLQDEAARYWPGIRYHVAQDGAEIGRWQYHAGGMRHPNLDGWIDIEEGDQELCYNELPTKQNWHYVRWVIDLATREYVELQSNDFTLDLRGKAYRYGNVHPHEQFPGNMNPDKPVLPTLHNMCNACLWVEADADRRAFVYLDSMVISTDW